MANIKISTWLRDRATGEAVKVVETGAMVRYQNSDVDGEVQHAKLEDHFEILSAKPDDAEDNF